MNILMPHTTTATELQRSYKKVAKRAKRLSVPIVVLSNNKPEGIYIDYETVQKGLFKKLRKGEKKDMEKDLSEFSGLWTEKEASEFNKVIDEMFEKIDYDMWK